MTAAPAAGRSRVALLHLRQVGVLRGRRRARRARAGSGGEGGVGVPAGAAGRAVAGLGGVVTGATAATRYSTRFSAGLPAPSLAVTTKSCVPGDAVSSGEPSATVPVQATAPVQEKSAITLSPWSYTAPAAGRAIAIAGGTVSSVKERELRPPSAGSGGRVWAAIRRSAPSGAPSRVTVSGDGPLPAMSGTAAPSAWSCQAIVAPSALPVMTYDGGAVAAFHVSVSAPEIVGAAVAAAGIRIDAAATAPARAPRRRGARMTWWSTRPGLPAPGRWSAQTFWVAPAGATG